MSYEITVNKETNIITVAYHKDTSHQERIEVLLKLSEILPQNPTMNVLVDTREAETNMSGTEQMEYGEMLASYKHLFTQNKTAIISVHRKNPHPIILAKAFVDGFSNFCEFSHKDEAIAWLKGEIS